MQNRSPRSSSSWLMAGAVAILVVVVTAWALRDIQRNRQTTEMLLTQQGAGLIKALEAGARTGMRGRLGQGARLQGLLEEAGRQDNILFIAVTDRNGRILAHSDQARTQQMLFASDAMSRFHPGPQAASRLVSVRLDAPAGDPLEPIEDAAGDVFLVYRNFLAPDEARSRHGMHEFLCPGNCPPDHAARQFGPGLIVFVGLDPEPFFDAVSSDARATIFFALLILAAGGGAFAALSWAARARASGRQLSEARAFTDELVASLPAGLIACDASGAVVSMNDSATRLLNLDPADCIGREPSEFLTAELFDVFSLAHAGERVVEQEITLPAGNRNTQEKERTLLVSASAVTTASGGNAGCVLILRDVSELKRLEEQVRRQEKLAAVGQLAAGVAHEIRNPLSSIKGFAVHLGSRFPKDSPDALAAQTLVAETDRLNRVVTELIEYARPTEASRTPTDPGAVIDHTMRLLRQEAADAGVTMHFEPCGELPKVDIDPDRVSQALLNLCLNAIQAMDEGGRLTVRACVMDGALEIEVEDTGPGIDPDVYEQIFDPYYTTKPRGQGLGLAVVRKVAEAHGGRVDIHSTPDAGSRFTLVLPTTRSES
ncbi:ATP-binding protein [Oceanidesulfovibrio indonesiensis]|nr:ATP-binding protein [Oceanidesulfovibrio indonesiensis]